MHFLRALLWRICVSEKSIGGYEGHLYEANDLLLIDQYTLVCAMLSFGRRRTEMSQGLLRAEVGLPKAL